MFQPLLESGTIAQVYVAKGAITAATGDQQTKASPAPPGDSTASWQVSPLLAAFLDGVGGHSWMGEEMEQGRTSHMFCC